MTVIGLTGGIASGKSTASGWLRELGAIVIDADRLGHRVYEPGSPGFEAVVNEFGHDLVAPDGTINRTLLGGKVFGDPTQMKRLTDIVWPEIQRLAAQEIAEIKRRDRTAHIVLEAAVLIEANWFSLIDQVWVVTVDPAVARTRLMARNNLTEAQAQARIDAQLTNKERLQHALVKFDNSGTLDQFRDRVAREWKRFTKDDEKPARTLKVPAAKPGASRAASKSASKAAAKPAAKAAAVASKATTARPAPKAVASKAVASKAAAPKAAAPKAAAPKAAAPKAAAPKAAAPKAAAPKAVATRSTATKAVAKPATVTKAVAKPATATKPVAKPATTSKAVAKAAPARAAAKATPAPATSRRAGRS